MAEVKITNCRIADSFMDRFWGLMGKEEKDSEQGLLLKKCGSVHTMFMKFTIQVIYLDDKYKVLDYEMLEPWKLGKIVKGCKHVFESPESKIINVQKDDYLVV